MKKLRPLYVQYHQPGNVVPPAGGRTYRLTPSQVAKFVVVLLAVALAACAGNPPNPLPTPTPVPPSTGPVNPEMLLHADGAVLKTPDGNAYDFRGAVACCNTEAGEPNPKWPLGATDWFDYLKAHGNINTYHKRLGPWRTGPGGEKEWAATGGAYIEVGGKADLTQFNPKFWDAVDNLLTEAAKRGMWAEVDLLDGWGIKHVRMGDIPGYHPWAPANNVQGEDHANPTFDAVQEAYIRKAVQAVGRHGNVVFETSNEGGLVPGWNVAWEQAIIATIHDEEGKRGYPRHLVATNAQQPVPAADWNEYHTGGGPQPPSGKVTGTNEYNPEPALSGATMFGNYCSARAAGTYYWLWRHSMSRAEWKAGLGMVKAGCGAAPACPHPDFNAAGWVAVPKGGQTGPDLVQAGEKVRAAHPDWFKDGCVYPLDDQHANILRVLNASAAQYRADGRCGWPEHDAVMAARLDGDWDEGHLVAYTNGCFLLPGNVVKHVWHAPAQVFFAGRAIRR